jgi:nucleoside-diphosphate-sugar epimerase
MNILVTGSTGFIGKHLVKELLSMNHNVFCLLRGDKQEDFRGNTRVRLVNGDIRDTDLEHRLPAKIDLVYHLAGIIGKWNIPEITYVDMNFKGTANLLKACVRLNAKRFIYCSTAGVLGPFKDSLLDESAPYNPTNIYEETKAEAEKLILEYTQTGKIEATIVRPEFVYGPGDFHVFGLFKLIKKGLFPLIDSGKALLHPTFIDDVIQGLKLCLSEKAIGQVYILAGERFISVKEFVNVIAKILKIRPPLINISKSTANFMATVFEASARLFRFEPPLTKARIKFFTQSRAFKINKIVEDLGYRPVSLEKGLTKTILWYKDNGYL